MSEVPQEEINQVMRYLLAYGTAFNLLPDAEDHGIAHEAINALNTPPQTTNSGDHSELPE